MRVLYILAMILCVSLQAQDVTTVKATDKAISDNLDLEAVASVFGESKDLEDFEKRLNDPKTQLSNLDLNADGEVDYLRVLETSKNKTHVVTIQAVTGKNEYQDVAVIDVDKDSGDEAQVQVVGDVFMYGPNYIVTTVYVRPPVIWVWFWGSLYRPWRSPYYWGNYPRYYKPWRPYPVSRYQKNVNVHINVNNTYNRTTVRNNNTAVTLQNQSGRNDVAAKNSSKAAKTSGRSTGKKVQDDWQTQAAKKDKKGTVKPTKEKVSKNKSKAKSTAKPAGKPGTKPTAKPSKKPAAKPATKPKAKTVKRAKGRGRGH